MERLTERKRNFDGTGAAVKGLADGLLTPFASEILTKLADYEDLEERLHKMFGEESTFSLADVVDTMEMRLFEPDKKHPINAKILTYEEADKWNEYKRLEEQGLMLKLPLGRDKKAYMVTYTFEDDKKEYYIQTVYPIYMTICTYQGMLGKTIFSTREEAEKKLKEMVK